jgi:hypothetical protein
MSSSFSEVQKYFAVVFEWSIEVYVLMFVIVAKRFACIKLPFTVRTWKRFLPNCDVRWRFMYVNPEFLSYFKESLVYSTLLTHCFIKEETQIFVNYNYNNKNLSCQQY